MMSFVELRKTSREEKKKRNDRKSRRRKKSIDLCGVLKVYIENIWSAGVIDVIENLSPCEKHNRMMTIRFVPLQLGLIKN